jgi:NADH-quinone oxidoreductase subunit J
MIQIVVFYLFATLVIASGVMTIASRNPVHSVLWLILAFFNAAGLFLLIGAEFLAFLLVIVYVGAVAVLFLFVVMMLDVDYAELRAGIARYWPFGFGLAGVILAEIFFGAIAWNAGGIALSAHPTPAASAQQSNIVALGALLYTRYLFIFEAAGIVLLVAMVGAIVLTRRKRSDVRPQSVSRQVQRRPRDAVVNMQPGVGQGVEL